MFKKKQVTPQEQQASPAEPTKETPAEEYSFPTKTRCPRCGGQSRRIGSHKDHQYRECAAPICRRKFSILGTKIVVKPAEPSPE